MERKRFWLFAGALFGGSGGIGDFRAGFAGEKEAIEGGSKALEEAWTDWVHVLDTETMELVYQEKKPSTLALAEKIWGREAV